MTKNPSDCSASLASSKRKNKFKIRLFVNQSQQTDSEIHITKFICTDVSIETKISNAQCLVPTENESHMDCQHVHVNGNFATKISKEVKIMEHYRKSAGACMWEG